MKTVRMSIYCLMLVFLILTGTTVMAQDALQKPTLEQLIPGGEEYRYAGNLYGLGWWGDVCMNGTEDELYTVDARTGKQTLVATLAEVAEAQVNSNLKPAHSFYGLDFPDARQPHALFFQPGQITRYDWEKRCVVSSKTYPKEGAHVDYQPVSGHVAYTLKNNLYVDGKAVTREPKGFLCGHSVHRNEFGIMKGTFWSPKGTLLAYYRMNESMVTPYPIVDVTQRIALTDPIRYPMAGMLSHEVKVGIYNPATDKSIYLDMGDSRNRYFTNISWAPDEKSIFVIEVNRDQNHAKLLQYSVETGQLMRVLLEERHEKYVEPQTPIVFLPWDETKFLYQSQRDGFNHLYLGRLTGDAGSLKNDAGQGASAESAEVQLEQLTAGDWLVQEFVGFNERRKGIYFMATKESPLNSNLYKINLTRSRRVKQADGSYVRQYPVTLLDNGEGIHRVQLSASGTRFIDRYAIPAVPRRIELAQTTGERRVLVFEAEDPYRGLEMPQFEVGQLKAADGATDLYYRMVRPADFDPGKKYPVVVYVYGGPHAQLITNGFQYSARPWDLYMASLGYIIFTVDGRGSSNRGLAFENCTFRQLGVEECKDQVEGVKFLHSLPYVDKERIGVHGWSFGGHMTTALMLRYPELFKAGVAGGPVIDWALYEVMYGERYMDTPQTNPEGYARTNLNNYAGNLKGRLLIIHGDHDATCVPQHTLSFMKACVDARTYPDLFLYPNHEHGVSGRDRVHLNEKITRYFEDYLK